MIRPSLARVRIPLWLWLPPYALLLVCRAAWWLARRWRLLLVLAATAGVWWGIASLGRWSVPVLFVPLMTVWSAAFWAPGWFDKWCETPIRSRWRRFWVFRRYWQPACASSGLDRGGELPRLGRVRSTAVAEEVRCRMLPGQTVRDFQQAGDRLAAAFGARSCRAYGVQGRPRVVVLRLARPVPVQATARRTSAPAAVEAAATEMTW